MPLRTPAPDRDCVLSEERAASPSANRHRGRVSARILGSAAGLLALLASVSAGQTDARDPAARPLEEAEQVAVVERVAELIDTRFYDREVGQRCAIELRGRLQRGEYRSVTAPAAFAELLTAQMRSGLDDQHALLTLDPLPTTPQPAPSRQQRDDELRASYRKRNFDFREVRLLEGNVGYLELFTFAPARMGAETAAAALHFLANSDAVILDLRGNRGGYPDMGLFIASHLFERSTHYANVYRREGDRTEQQWTTNFVTGPLLTRQDVFILLGRDSFSGAESLAYNLQALGRATIVGEQTRGGATGINTLRVNERFQVSVSDVNFTSPVTNSNWEATGVVPDVPCARAEALVVAHLLALERLAEKSDDPAQKTELAWARVLVEASARRSPAASEQALQEFCGQYGSRNISLEAGALQYRRGEDAILALRAVGTDLFMLDGIAAFQLRFERDAGGRVVRAVACYPDGETDSAERTR